MQTILVTGGAGFIGSHTVKLLLAKGMNVVVYDNLLTGQLNNLDLTNPRLKFVKADILDYPLLFQEIKNCDAVLHLAAIASVPQSIEDPIQSLQVNTQGFLHILQAIRKLDRPIRCVYASSAAVYGCIAKLPCSDEVPLPLVTLSPYALEKANNERYADLFDRLCKVKSLGLRYFNVYGPDQDPNSPYAGVIAKFIQHYQHEQPITIFGDGKQSRDFIHVSDVAKANWLALTQDCYGVLNIATGVSETLLNLVHYIEQTGDKKAIIQYAEPRMGDIRKSYAEIDKAKRQLGFQYEVQFEQGIASLMNQAACIA